MEPIRLTHRRTGLALSDAAYSDSAPKLEVKGSERLSSPSRHVHIGFAMLHRVEAVQFVQAPVLYLRVSRWQGPIHLLERH